MRAGQHGVAIILAMGVVALAAVVATSMMATQSTWVRQNELGADHVQAQALIRAGVDWTRALLSDDRRSSNVDYLDEPWALRLPPIPVENGSLAGQIEDQQGRFNLNNLVRDGKINQVQLTNFQRLLSSLGLPPALAGALADWIDADNEQYDQDGAEDEYYLALPSPYLTANRPLLDVSELVLVRGFDESARARLRPYITALPRFTAVNANTATAEVLAAVIKDLGLERARAVVAQRERTYFRNLADFYSLLPSGSIVPSESISVSSDYFMVSMRVTLGGAQARGSALLARESAGWPIVVWRKYP